MKATRITTGLFFLVTAIGTLSCNKSRQTEASGGEAFDPSQAITISGFKPRTGGIATQMIIDGTNFGNDTVGLSVYFVDSLGTRHKGGIVSSNGEKIYLTVPKLTYLRTLKLEVEKKLGDKTYVSKSEDMKFLYKTEVSVSTVIGQASTNNQLPTVGGSFAGCTLSAPAYLTLDDEDNLFICERPHDFGLFARDAAGHTLAGNAYAGNILLGDTKNETLTVLRYLNYEPLNAPTFSDESGEEAVYFPEDRGRGYLRLRKGANYAIQKQSMLFANADQNPFKENNWKHSMLINKKDKMLYTILWKGQLLRINPRTRQSELLIEKVVPDIPNEKGGAGSDNYYIFSPLEPNVMYVALCDYNMIKKIDLDKIPQGDPRSYRGTDYAGLAISDGPVSGRGWEDGMLRQAKFNNPRQLAFTSDGKLYIADTNNHCIRVIDTTISEDQVVVNTAVGVPGTAGFRDGGPDQALFNRPTGVAVSSDGSVLYVADHMNHVIRKLAIQ